MLTNDGRAKRAAQHPAVEGVPPLPGILAAMALAPALGMHMRGIAHALLVEPFADSTLCRHECELIALHVSVSNACYFCGDSHGAFAQALLVEGGCGESVTADLVDNIKVGNTSSLDPRMRALVAIAGKVADNPLLLHETEYVGQALEAGASPGDIRHAMMIASAFAMFNRMVESMGTFTPNDPGAFAESAERIRVHGYVMPEDQPKAA